jgi:hypothetical protein
MYVVDRAASKARAEQLQTYLAERVLTSRREFICSSASSCKASLQRAGSAFLEAQGHAVGPCYDLATVDGVPLRILVVPMESGGSNPDYQHINVAERTSHVEAAGAKPFRDRNPHMKGVALALRLAFGLPVDDPKAEYLQFTDGTTAQLFSCFAMTNLLLCSAVAAGTMSSRSTAVMRANCARHLVETVKILQPTLVISQGQGLDTTLRASLGVTATVNPNLADCTLHGNRFTWVSLYHPTRNWSALSHPYLHEVVVPTISQARPRALALAESATPPRPAWPGPQVSRDSVLESEMLTRGVEGAAAAESAVPPRSKSLHGANRDANDEQRQARRPPPAAHGGDDPGSGPHGGGNAAIVDQVRREDPADFVAQRFQRVPPSTTLGHARDDNLRERRLTAVLRQATGLDSVRPVRPEIGGVVMLDAAIGTKTTQRICLQQHGDTVILRTWLAELKPQAQALYRTGKAPRLIQLLSERRGQWYARANVHLAFRNAAAALRLYPHCRLEASEYIQRWSGNDFAHVGAHPRDQLRSSLWPWLRSREYAGPEDDDELDAFLNRLGRRDVHLRPSLEVTRYWPWAEAVELDERGALTGEVRSAVAELLSALNEPLPPACVVAR